MSLIHFVKVLKAKIKSFKCKHLSVRLASCPFTGLTYTICNECLSRIKAERARDGKEK